jgi:hypothetical protein
MIAEQKMNCPDVTHLLRDGLERLCVSPGEDGGRVVLGDTLCKDLAYFAVVIPVYTSKRGVQINEARWQLRAKM